MDDMTHSSTTHFSLHGATSEIDHGVLGDDIAGCSRFATVADAVEFAHSAAAEARYQGWTGPIEIAIHDETSADPIETVSA